MEPQIATILENGTYGQRDMTVEEITQIPINVDPESTRIAALPEPSAPLEPAPE